ncbi:MAG: ferrous iron transport protein B [Nannocystaceae bacterium]
MSSAAEKPLRVALAGNPNVGKTSLFNELTSSRHRVGNYAGVTVERREGELAARFDVGRAMTLLDLPGCYSLSATAEDEAVAYRELAGSDVDAVVLVVDATNLARNLYFALQVRELGVPMVVALNMSDTASELGMPVDAEALRDRLGVPVVATSGRTGIGCDALARAVAALPRTLAPALVPLGAQDEDARAALRAHGGDSARARWLVCTAAAGTAAQFGATAAELAADAPLQPARRGAAAAQIIAARYAEVDRMLAAAVGASDQGARAMALSERIDRVLTHRLWGLLAFALVMATMFTAVFTWAEPLMGAIEDTIGWCSEHLAEALGPGLFTDLLTQGVLAGVGNVLVFVPQIAMLFLFICLLEDSGYLARAAFLMDRMMARLGLHGRAFIPLLSAYACAVPSILGTRAIASFKDRLVTILMIPYMSCSARLPIYSLVIGALFVTAEDQDGAGLRRAGIMLGMYALSTCSALVAGFVYKRTVLRSPTPALVLELPPYRLPRLRNTLLVVYDRTMDFVRNAGTVILGLTIVLWALLSFPRQDTGAGEGGKTEISRSYGGRAAQVLEPALEPIGQDWRIGVGIIASFAAREVLVGTLGVVYGLESEEDEPVGLREAIREDRNPQTGARRHTPLSGLALMVFFVYACQCMSTLAVVRRETRSWRWPAFMFVSMTAIAYLAALLVFQGGRALGLG